MEKRKSMWPKIIIGFFGVVFTVNFFFLYVSLKSYDGLTDEDYYEKGLHYDSIKKSEESLGWNIEIKLDSSEADTTGSSVVVGITDAAGDLVSDANVVVDLRRPATSRYDRTVTLTESAASYRASIEIPMDGLWDIRVRAEKSGAALERTFRVRVEDHART